MRGRCIALLGCVLALVARTRAAAVPTPDTMVVAKSDGEALTSPIPPVTESSLPSEAPTKATPSPTTEGPPPPLKMTQMDVRSDVALRYARTAVVTRVKNPARRAQEATFRVLLPETAFISGFTMILDGKPYKAYVKEKEEAKQIYTQAVSQGIGAAHIAAKARDSNHFTVSVNVEANTTAVFNLTYEELLVRRNNVYNHAINLHPGAVVPKMTVTVHIREADKITALRVPEVRTGNEVDATEDDAQNSKAVIVRGHDDREATITFTPDVQEQQRLMDVYAAKSKESQSESNSYRHWYAGEEEQPKPEGVLGQFVVQYDVDRPKEGQILVSDGYFVHFFAPSSLPPLNKHVVFVLDTSGSMMDRKIVQLRQAMQTILGELNRGDYFNIVQFDSGVKVFDLKEADEPEKPATYNYYNFGAESGNPTTLVPPSPATEQNVAKAKAIVSRLHASGGTNIYSALNVAVDLIQKGVGWTPEVANATTTETPAPIPTPIALESQDINNTPKETPKTDAKSGEEKKTDIAKTGEKKEEPKNLEPIIIFLTDGDPTVGETSPTRIINHLTEKNYGDNKASIFSLAFGEDADRSFLRKLSLRSDGFMRHIYEAADAALQLRDFYRQVSSPLLAHVKFTYPPEQVKQDSLTKNKFRTFYSGSETVVAGRVADGAQELSSTIVGICGVDDGFTRKKYEIFPKVPVAAPRGEYLPLERLWAYLTVKQLLDERDAKDELVDAEKDKENENTPEKKALAIALKYEFVTPLTSLVVVKPNATNAVDAESVDKNIENGPIAFGAAVPLAAHSHSYASIPASSFLAGGLPGAPGAQYALNNYRKPAGTDGLTLRSEVAFSSAIGPLLPAPIYASPMVGYDDAADFAVDEEEALLVSTPALPIASSTPPPRLETLGLEALPWVEPLLDWVAEKITIKVNDTEIQMEVVRGQAPKSPAGDAECARPTDGGATGVCVYLTRCDAAKDIDAKQYVHTYCLVDDKYAGVCCPSTRVDLNTTHSE